ncbi:50S ribosomal protein L37ae [Candidatus Woesearchaeota archaeon]|nr:50S ribosomal protein L37ae [Candidatus Woesearchaeota archaeon]
MARQSKLTSTKRFGPRYGITVKQRFDQIEQLQKKAYQCTSCKKMKVKRLALGIWQCQGCHMKFAGKAYSFGTEAVLQTHEQEEFKLTLTPKHAEDQEATDEAVVGEEETNESREQQESESEDEFESEDESQEQSENEINR